MARLGYTAPEINPDLDQNCNIELFFFYVFCFSHRRSHRQAAQHTAAQHWRRPNDHMRAFTKTHVPQSQKYALMARSVKAASGALLPSPTPTPTTPHHTTSLFLYTRGRVSVFVTPSVFFGRVLSKQKRRRNVSRRAAPTVQLASCQDGLPTRMRPAVSTSGLTCVKCVTGGICIIFGKQRKIPHKAAYCCSEFVFLPSLSHD